MHIRMKNDNQQMFSSIIPRMHTLPWCPTEKSIPDWMAAGALEMCRQSACSAVNISTMVPDAIRPHKNTNTKAFEGSYLAPSSLTTILCVRSVWRTFRSVNNGGFPLRASLWCCIPCGARLGPDVYLIESLTHVSVVCIVGSSAQVYEFRMHVIRRCQVNFLYNRFGRFVVHRNDYLEAKFLCLFCRSCGM